MNIMMNPDEDHQRMQQHSEVLSRTQQHSEVQNVYLDFQVKASGSQDRWQITIGHPPTATRAQELYK